MTTLIKTFRERSLPLAICLTLTLGFASCDKNDDEGSAPAPEHTFVFDVVDAKATESTVTDYTVELQIPNGSLKSFQSETLKSEEGDVSIDASDFETGRYDFVVTKNGYVTDNGSFVFDKSKYESNEGWSYTQKVYLNKLEDAFEVDATSAKVKTFDNKQVIVEIPQGAVSETKNISITPIVTPFQRNENAVVNGKIALCQIHCLPEGTTFATPLTVKFKVDASVPASTPLKLSYFDANAKTWETYPVTREGEYCVAQISHFSDWYLTVDGYKFEEGEIEESDYILDLHCNPGVGIDETTTVDPVFFGLDYKQAPMPSGLALYAPSLTFRVVEPAISDCEQHLKVGYTIQHIEVYQRASATSTNYTKIGEIGQPVYPLHKTLYAKKVAGQHHGGTFVTD